MPDIDHHKSSAIAKWALGIAQGLTLMSLGWFGRQQLDMHDQLNQLTWEMAQVRSNAAMVVTNKSAIDMLGFRLSDIEKRQAKDDDFREQFREYLSARKPRAEKRD